MCLLPKRHVRVVGLLCTLISAGCATAEENKPPAKPAPPQIKWEKKQLQDNFNEACEIADVNKDGALDVIAGPSWFEAPSWKRHPIRELTPLGPAADQLEFLGTNGDHAIDLNGDGYVDIISASWFTDSILWYENPGKDGLASDAMWKEHLACKGHPECEGTLLKDLDGDGVPELLIDQWHDYHPVTVVRITPGKNGGSPEFKAFDIGDHNGHGIAVGDVNGDGRLDVLVEHGWYEAPEDRWSAKWKYHKAFGLDHVSLPFLVVDLNGDGKNDVIVGQGHDYGLMWFEQGEVKDGEITWIKHDIDNSISQLHCLAWADLDGDGQPELITGKRYRAHADNDPGAHDPMCMFRYIWDAKNKTFQRDTISWDDGVSTGMQIQAVDIDGDKKLDLVVAGKKGTHILFNRGPVSEAHASR